MNFEIRDAQPDDVADLVALTRELAQFESLTHLFVATEADLADALSLTLTTMISPQATPLYLALYRPAQYSIMAGALLLSLISPTG